MRDPHDPDEPGLTDLSSEGEVLLTLLAIGFLFCLLIGVGLLFYWGLI